MKTFLTGLFILIVGASLYGKLCEKVFGPDDRKTPAYTKQDGVDYIPMKGWKNSLINLLNIAGTGPIFGPIQGILFGPIAFITIPIGNIIGGAMHDYFSGMICLRDGGTQMSGMINKYTNNLKLSQVTNSPVMLYVDRAAHVRDVMATFYPMTGESIRIGYIHNKGVNLSFLDGHAKTLNHRIHLDAWVKQESLLPQNMKFWAPIKKMKL